MSHSAPKPPSKPAMLGWVGTLPVELKKALVDQARFSDLRALALVSKDFYDLAATRMFGTLVISADEDKLVELGGRPFWKINHQDHPNPLSPFPTRVRHLKFEAQFHRDLTRRCVHHRETSERVESFYSSLMPFFQQLQEHMLTSFSWDLGVCVPDEILGVGGYLPEHQQAIKSLSLITGGPCAWTEDIAPDIDSYNLMLETFQSVKNFTWKGIRSRGNLQSLQRFFEINLNRLEDLNLDLSLVHWDKVVDGQGWDVAAVFNEDAAPGRAIDIGMTFSALATLTLCGVQFSGEGVQLARAFNINHLRSLTLHHCDNTAGFLYAIVKSGESITLREFEVMLEDRKEAEWSNTALIAFLQSFHGLQRLHIMADLVGRCLSYWQQFSNHWSSLRSFSFHLRTRVPDTMFPTFRDGSRIHDRINDPVGWPIVSDFFASTNLECFGFSVKPKKLRRYLESGSSHQGLKLLHLRLTAPEGCLNTIVRDLASFLRPDGPLLLTATANIRTEPQQYVDACSWFRFVAWAFDCHKLPNLQVLAMGDFLYNGRHPDHNILFCRDTVSSVGYSFRVMDRDEVEPMRGIDRPWEFLGACPRDTLMSLNSARTLWPGTRG